MDVPQDYFDRKRFAKLLISHIKILPTPFALGLDAPWGYGKSFFIQHVLKPEAKTDIPLVVYDAFEHEKDGDVFLSLVTSILEQTVLLNRGDTTVVQDAICSVAKSTAQFFKSTCSVGLNSISKLALRQSTDDIANTYTSDKAAVENFSNGVQASVEKFILERTRPGNSYRDVKANFQSSMRKLIVAMSDNAKLVVVIDDLDRCTPKHALEVLEAVHHLLNTDGIVFLFSYHREQLERMVEHTYGSGIDTAQYLSKFIGFNIQFPETENQISRAGMHSLAKDRFDTYSENIDLNDEVLVKLFEYLSLFSIQIEISARLTQAFASLAIAIRRFCYGASNALTFRDLTLVILWKLTKPNELIKLAKSELSSEEARELRSSLEFDRWRRTATLDEDILDSMLGGSPSHPSARDALRKNIQEILALGR